MPKPRVPGWWLAVGVDTAEQIKKLFVQIVEELTMRDGDLAKKLEVDPSTLWRWKAKQGTPSLEVMQQAVEKVREELKRQLDRVTVAEKVLDLVSAIEKEQNAKGLNAGRKEAARLKKLLDDLAA